MHWVEDMLVVLQVLPVCSDCQTPYDAYLGIPFHIANSSLKGVICTSHEVHIASTNGGTLARRARAGHLFGPVPL